MIETYFEKLGHLSEIVINPTPNCNLRCRYCYDRFRDNRSTDTSITTAEPVFDAIKRMIDFVDNPRMNFSFIGGEALTVGLEYFEHFEEVMAGIPHDPPYIQSNLTLLDDDYCAFFKKHDYRLGVSFDGIPEVHNYNRGEFAATMGGIALAIENRLLTLVTCTVTDMTAKHVEEVFELFALIGAPLRFNAGAAIFDGVPVTAPIRYKRAMQKFAELWFDFGQPFKWQHIKEVCRKVESQKWVDVSKPGVGACMTGSLNVEWDGRVNICAACAHDENFILGNIVTDRPIRILFHKNRIGFFARTRQSRAHCATCVFRWICMGTCFANVNTWGAERDPYCAGGAGMYKSILERLGITLKEYKEMIPQRHHIHTASAQHYIKRRSVAKA